MKFHKNKNKNKFSKICVCPKCGPYVRVMAEVWEAGSSGPFALEFLNQLNGDIKTAFTIKMHEPKEPCEIVRYYRCGHCDCFTGPPDLVPQSMLDDIEKCIDMDSELNTPKKKKQ